MVRVATCVKSGLEHWCLLVPCHALTVVTCSVSSVPEGLAPAYDYFAGAKFNSA